MAVLNLVAMGCGASCLRGLSDYETVGMISGNGVYPETFAAAARNAGVSKLVAAAFTGETREDLGERVDVLSWFRVGQLGKMIKFFRKEGVEKAVMVGQILDYQRNSGE